MKTIFRKIGEVVHAVTESLSSLSLLLARLILGFVFLPAGWGKLHNLERTVGFFESLGIPYASLQAPFVAGVETLCGLLLLIGLSTRFAAFPLMIIMVVAIATAHFPSMESWRDLLDLSDFLYFAILFIVLTKGAGSLSADAMICRLRRGQSGSH